MQAVVRNALQDSLAMKLPAAVCRTEGEVCSADQLIFEFWQGTMPVGVCRLPIKIIYEKMTAQARAAVPCTPDIARFTC